MQVLLLQQGRARSNTADVSDNRGSALLKHVLEKLNCLVLQRKSQLHLGRGTLGRGVLSRVSHLSIHHQNLEQCHVCVTGWGVERDQDFLVTTNQILEDV